MFHSFLIHLRHRSSLALNIPCPSTHAEREFNDCVFARVEILMGPSCHDDLLLVVDSCSEVKHLRVFFVDLVSAIINNVEFVDGVALEI